MKRRKPEVTQIDYWTNQYNVRMMKQCCSCANCKGGDTMSVNTTLRYCSPHKIDGGYSSAIIVDRRDLGCLHWRPKTGLFKAGNGKGHALREVDVEGIMAKLGVPKYQKEKVVKVEESDERILKKMRDGLERFERESIAEQEGGEG